MAYERAGIQVNNNDAYYERGDGTTNSGEYELGHFGTPFDSYGTAAAAVRFPNILLTHSQSIISAQLSLYVSGRQAGGGTIRFIGYGIKEVNTSSFSSSPFGRTRTTASKTGTSSVPATGSYLNIDVTNLVNEIIGQGSWASGNAMGFLILDNGSDTGNVIYDGTEQARLSITISATPDLTPDPITVAAPTFPAPQDYGIRISAPNIDVKKAVENQIYFTSRKKELRVSSQGEVYNNESGETIPHGLSYIPCVLGYWSDASGRHLYHWIAGGFTVSLGLTSDDTNVYVITLASQYGYYYVFVDPLADS